MFENGTSITQGTRIPGAKEGAEGAGDEVWLIHFSPETHYDDGDSKTIEPAVYRVVTKSKMVHEVLANRVVISLPLDQEQAFQDLIELLKEEPEPKNGAANVSASS